MKSKYVCIIDLWNDILQCPLNYYKVSGFSARYGE
jgi:hypothetical protein